jgi:hypothetical protein
MLKYFLSYFESEINAANPDDESLAVWHHEST